MTHDDWPLRTCVPYHWKTFKITSKIYCSHKVGDLVNLCITPNTSITKDIFRKLRHPIPVRRMCMNNFMPCWQFCYSFNHFEGIMALFRRVERCNIVIMAIKRIRFRQTTLNNLARGIVFIIRYGKTQKLQKKCESLKIDSYVHSYF